MQVSATAQLGQILMKEHYSILRHYFFTKYLCIFHTLIMQKLEKKLIHKLIENKNTHSEIISTHCERP